MGRIDDAINFFHEEIRQIDIALQGILDKSYREYLINKKQYYELAESKLAKSYKSESGRRLTAIQNGAIFGERDIYSLSEGDIYEYRLLEVLDSDTGDILVEDISTKPYKAFITNVNAVSIKGISF